MATTGFIPATLQKMWNVWNIRGFMIMSLTVQLVLALASPLRKKTSNFNIILIVWSAYFLADWTTIFAWSIWNIRGFMIMSLTVQLVLALTSPLRPKTSNIVVISVVWSAYLLADWTAIFSFGLISNAGFSKSPSHVVVSNDLLALWASFLLIHLGGPDTITAFSLEDNALWLRHLVSLIAQLFTFFYIFVKNLPDNKLMGPVVLVFMTGVIKYGERTRALYLASLENFKESTIKLPNQGVSMDLASILPEEEEDSDKKLVRVFHFFQIFKGLIVDIMPNHSQRLESREFFLKQDADSAFKFMSTELTLLYKVFYTKIMAVNSSWGVFIRIITFYMSVAAFVLFFINKKEELHTTDIWITYALLAGVIALDMTSEVMLTSSNWSSNKSEFLGCQIIGRCFFPFLMSILMYSIVIFLMYVFCCGHVVERLWSVKMGSFNLLVYSFEEGRPRNGCSLVCCCCRAIFGLIAEKIGIAEAIAEMRYGSKNSMDEGIWKYMYGILQGKASSTDEPKKVREIYEARGELTLRESSDELKRYVNDFEYDQTVLFWHIATEICYNTDPNIDKNNESVKFSKTFSDYMIYLLVKQPDMMSAVAGIFHKRYRDTCGELKRFEQWVRSGTLEEFCSSVLTEYGSSLEPGNKDRDAGRSVLTDSCHLANLLARSERKWEVICGVWVELLSYAACHCRVVSHARIISEGGEFVTFVWLSMAHLGIGPHFSKN